MVIFSCKNQQGSRMLNRLLFNVSLLGFLLLSLGCKAPLGDIKADNPQAIKYVAQDFSGLLPISPRIIKGQLDNGITYLIRQNNTPEKPAEIRLIVKAGSILQDDNQQGFDHFVEHMAFNGTEDFDKQEIIEYAGSIGMKFGSHLNAYANFDETVYKLQIPIEAAGSL
jgi:zinc protease